MWRVEYDPAARLLSMRLVDAVDGRQARALARAHAGALEATAGAPFRVLFDLRGLAPLDEDAAAVLADVKRVAATLAGYQGRAILVDSPTIAMQQRRATLEEEAPAVEVITTDPDEARSFLDSL